MGLRMDDRSRDGSALPVGWTIESLADVATTVASGRSKVQKGNGEYPVFGSTGIIGYSKDADYSGEAILVARVGANAGRLNLVSGSYGVTDNTILLRLRSDVSLHYYWRQLENRRLNSLVFGSGQPLITGTQLKSLPIPTPPLPEQKAIAAALSDVDALLGALDRLIAKKGDLKQAAMQQLLTGQTRLPGFSGKWERVRLEGLSAFITKGSTPTTYGYSWETDGVLFLRSECVSDEGLDLRQSMFISESAHATLRRSEIRNGDILMTITGNVGRVVLLEGLTGTANINQHIARIRIHADRAHPPFVYHFLSQRMIRDYYGSITTGQAYPQISLQQVRKTELPLPSLHEQEAVAAVLSDMDTELTALEQRRDKTRLLKQGMMQELLTGRTRLV